MPAKRRHPIAKQVPAPVADPSAPPPQPLTTVLTLTLLTGPVGASRLAALGAAAAGSLPLTLLVSDWQHTGVAKQVLARRFSLVEDVDGSAGGSSAAPAAAGREVACCVVAGEDHNSMGHSHLIASALAAGMAELAAALSGAPPTRLSRGEARTSFAPPAMWLPGVPALTLGRVLSVEPGDGSATVVRSVASSAGTWPACEEGGGVGAVASGPATLRSVRRVRVRVELCVPEAATRLEEQVDLSAHPQRVPAAALALVLQFPELLGWEKPPEDDTGADARAVASSSSSSSSSYSAACSSAPPTTVAALIDTLLPEAAAEAAHHPAVRSLNLTAAPGPLPAAATAWGAAASKPATAAAAAAAASKWGAAKPAAAAALAVRAVNATTTRCPNLLDEKDESSTSDDETDESEASDDETDESEASDDETDESEATAASDSNAIEILSSSEEEEAAAAAASSRRAAPSAASAMRSSSASSSSSSSSGVPSIAPSASVASAAALSRPSSSTMGAAAAASSSSAAGVPRRLALYPYQRAAIDWMLQRETAYEAKKLRAAADAAARARAAAGGAVVGADDGVEVPLQPLLCTDAAALHAAEAGGGGTAGGGAGRRLLQLLSSHVQAKYAPVLEACGSALGLECAGSGAAAAVVIEDDDAVPAPAAKRPRGSADAAASSASASAAEVVVARRARPELPFSLPWTHDSVFAAARDHPLWFPLPVALQAEGSDCSSGGVGSNSSSGSSSSGSSSSGISSGGGKPCCAVFFNPLSGATARELCGACAAAHAASRSAGASAPPATMRTLASAAAAGGGAAGAATASVDLDLASSSSSPAPPQRRFDCVVRGGLLCDQMGLGKTLEITGLVCVHPACPQPFAAPPGVTGSEALARAVSAAAAGSPAAALRALRELARAPTHAALAFEAANSLALGGWTRGQAAHARRYVQGVADPLASLGCAEDPYLLESRATLILVPPALLGQWEEELARWAPQLAVVVYPGRTRARANWDGLPRPPGGGRGGSGKAAASPSPSAARHYLQQRLALAAADVVLASHGALEDEMALPEERRAAGGGLGVAAQGGLGLRSRAGAGLGHATAAATATVAPKAASADDDAIATIAGLQPGPTTSGALTSTFWHRLVVDEVQLIGRGAEAAAQGMPGAKRRLAVLQQVQAAYRWPVSGTPLESPAQLAPVLQLLRAEPFGDESWWTEVMAPALLFSPAAAAAVRDAAPALRSALDELGAVQAAAGYSEKAFGARLSASYGGGWMYQGLPNYTPEALKPRVNAALAAVDAAAAALTAAAPWWSLVTPQGHAWHRSSAYCSSYGFKRPFLGASAGWVNEAALMRPFKALDPRLAALLPRLGGTGLDLLGAVLRPMLWRNTLERVRDVIALLPVHHLVVRVALAPGEQALLRELQRGYGAGVLVQARALLLQQRDGGGGGGGGVGAGAGAGGSSSSSSSSSASAAVAAMAAARAATDEAVATAAAIVAQLPAAGAGAYPGAAAPGPGRSHMFASTRLEESAVLAVAREAVWDLRCAAANSAADGRVHERLGLKGLSRRGAATLGEVATAFAAAAEDARERSAYAALAGACCAADAGTLLVALLERRDAERAGRLPATTLKTEALTPAAAAATRAGTVAAVLAQLQRARTVLAAADGCMLLRPLLRPATAAGAADAAAAASSRAAADDGDDDFIEDGAEDAAAMADFDEANAEEEEEEASESEEEEAQGGKSRKKKKKKLTAAEKRQRRRCRRWAGMRRRLDARLQRFSAPPAAWPQNAASLDIHARLGDAANGFVGAIAAADAANAAVQGPAAKLTYARQVVATLTRLAVQLARGGSGAGAAASSPAAAGDGDADEPVVCFICFEPPSQEEAVLTPCGHVYCAPCLLAWVATKNGAPPGASGAAAFKLAPEHRATCSCGLEYAVRDLYVVDAAAADAAGCEQGMAPLPHFLGGGGGEEGRGGSSAAASASVAPPASSSCSSSSTSSALPAGVLSSAEANAIVLPVRRAAGAAAAAAAGASHGAKLTALCRRLRSLPADEKAIVATSWGSLRGLASAALADAGIGHVLIDAALGPEAVASALQRFKSAPARECRALILAVATEAAGLTLTVANHVFCLDPVLSPAVMAQLVGRIARQGQTRPCFVWDLVAAGSIEEGLVRMRDRLARGAGAGGAAGTQQIDASARAAAAVAALSAGGRASSSSAAAAASSAEASRLLPLADLAFLLGDAMRAQEAQVGGLAAAAAGAAATAAAAVGAAAAAAQARSRRVGSGGGAGGGGGGGRASAGAAEGGGGVGARLSGSGTRTGGLLAEEETVDV